MKVAGFSRQTFSDPNRASAISPWNFDRHGPPPWSSAIRSSAMNPTLCRFPAYFAPGLPRPTQSCIAASSPRPG